jgi:DNA-binding transcriptional LysR family regulator
MQLALEHAGIGMLVERFARPLVAAGRLEPVLPEWRALAATAWAVLPGRRLLPAKTRTFVEALIAALEP